MVKGQSLSLGRMGLFEGSSGSGRNPVSEPHAPDTSEAPEIDDVERRKDISLQEFSVLARENQRRLFQIAQSVLRNAEQAEEIAQDALLAAYRKLDRLKEPDRFRAWVGRIAFRLALNARRASIRRGVRDTLWASEVSPPRAQSDDGERALFLRDVEHAVDRLPDRLRTVLLLCAVEDMSSAEAASILRIPEGTVRSRLHQARKIVLKEVGK